LLLLLVEVAPAAAAAALGSSAGDVVFVLLVDLHGGLRGVEAVAPSPAHPRLGRRLGGGCGGGLLLLLGVHVLRRASPAPAAARVAARLLLCLLRAVGHV
jgi:hypothetical protein